MNNKAITAIVVILVLIVAGGIIYVKNFQGSAVTDTASESVAKWIGTHSVLYFQPTCIHCIDQEKLFGDNVKYLNMVDCTKPENLQKCIDLGIDATPTWIINGQKYVGVQSIDTLKNLTSYQD